MVFRKIFINRREKRNMNKLFCQCLPVLDISKIPIYDFWYDYKKAEIWGGSKIMLHGYNRQLYSLHKDKIFT